MAEYVLLQDCVYCGGDGVVTTSGSNDGVPFSVDRPCTNCGGTGKRSLGIVTLEPSLEEILTKCEELKTKINQMRADINYIKGKV